MNTKALRQKILDLAIHGKLVPQNPKDESATVLLEKIRAEKAEKIKQGELKADKKDSFIFVGSDKRHYEQFADGTVKDIEDEIPFDVPESWAWCRLGEAGIITDTGYPFDASLFTNDSKNRKQIIRIRDILRGYSETYSDENCPDSYIVNEGDILIGMDGDFNIAKWKTDGALLNQRVCRINKNNELINLDYVFYLLPIPLLEINKNTSSVTVKHLSNKQIENLIFPIPPFNEQNRIINHLENIFSQIRMLEQNKSVLQTAIKQAKSKILDLAIHGKLVPQDPNDESAEELLKRIATSDNRPYEKVGEEPFEIPHSWKLVRLGAVCDYGKCINVSTSDLRANDWILDLEDIEKDSGKILAFHTLRERKSESTKHKFTKGQVLYSKLRPYLNKVVIAPKDGFCTSEILPLDFNEILINRFAQIVLMSSYFLTLVNMVTYGVKMPRLGTSDAKNMLIPIPPPNEQKRIVSKIDELFSNLDQIQNNLI